MRRETIILQFGPSRYRIEPGMGILRGKVDKFPDSVEALSTPVSDGAPEKRESSGYRERTGPGTQSTAGKAGNNGESLSCKTKRILLNQFPPLSAAMRKGPSMS